MNRYKRVLLLKSKYQITGSDYIFKIFILKLLSGYHMDIFQMGHALKCCDIKYQKLFFRHFVFGWLWILFLILMCYHIII